MFKNLLIILVLVPFLVPAQTTPLNRLFDKSIEEPGFSSSEIKTRDVTFEWEKEEGTENIREVLDGIESIRVLSYDDNAEEARKDAGKVYEKMEKAIEKDDYTVAMSFSSDEDKVDVYFLKDGDKVREFALISKGKEKVTMITVTGDLDMAKMMRKETMKGLWSLKSFYSGKKHTEVQIESEEGKEM
jgi:3-oxoacyl-ACP reductase-like protein